MEDPFKSEGLNDPKSPHVSDLPVSEKQLASLTRCHLKATAGSSFSGACGITFTYIQRGLNYPEKEKEHDG